MAVLNRPTHLQDSVAPRETPLRKRNSHHVTENAESFRRWCDESQCLCSLQNANQESSVSAMKKIKILSPMICLDCVISPFSNVIRKQARSAVDTRQSKARIVKYATATVRIPNEAGRIRIAVYGQEKS